MINANLFTELVDIVKEQANRVHPGRLRLRFERVGYSGQARVYSIYRKQGLFYKKPWDEKDIGSLKSIDPCFVEHTAIRVKFRGL